MVRDFDRSSGDRVVQQADKHSGLPPWVVEVIDADPDARQRTVKVKIAAQVQPVLPSPAPGSLFTAVEFDGMTATPYVDASRCSGDGKNKCAEWLSSALITARSPAYGRGVDRQAAVLTVFRTGISARLGWCRRPIADVPLTPSRAACRRDRQEWDIS